MKTFMKQGIAFFIASLIAVGIYAQAPEKFNYQAVVRDKSGNALTNQSIVLRMSIHESSATGTIVYQEIQNVTTNKLGIVNIQIGGVNPENGYDFSKLDWSSKSKYIQIEIDYEGGSNFVDMGSTELLSVPYALYAKQSGSDDTKGGSWNTTGNAGILATDFIGTTDNNDIVFKRSALNAGRIGLVNVSFGLSSNPANTGNGNTAIGVKTLSLNTIGNYNTAVGSFALKSNTQGLGNVGIGLSALTLNTTGIYNTASGYLALGFNTTGNFNTANGGNALYGNNTGISNTAIGAEALFTNTTGSNNTACGRNALTTSTTGSSNTAIGFEALKLVTTGSNNIGIGNNAQVPNVAGSNQVRIGNASIIYAGIQVGWSVTSDSRLKSDIKKSDLGLDFIMKLNPVSYTRLTDDSKKTEYGFIAQELEESLNNSNAKSTGIITKDDNGMYSVRYNDLIAPITKAIQEQQALIESLKIELAAQNEINLNLQKQIDGLIK